MAEQSLVTAAQTARQRLAITQFPEVLLWAVLAVPLAHVILLPAALSWDKPAILWFLGLHPLAVLVLSFVYLSTARGHQRPSMRWSSILLGVTQAASAAIFLVIIQNFSRSEDQAQVYTPSVVLAVTAVYFVGGMASMFQLPVWRWSALHTLRICVDIAVSIVIFHLVLTIGLPLLIPGWQWTETVQFAVLQLSFGLGTLYGVGMMFARFGNDAHAVHGFWTLAVSSEVLSQAANLAAVVLIAAGGSTRLAMVAVPCAMIQQVLWAFGTYRSIQSPPRWLASPRPLPLDEGWLSWLALPRLGGVIGLLVVAFGITVGQTSLLLLVAALVAREIVLTIEKRAAVRQRDQAIMRQQIAEAQTQTAYEHLEAMVRRILHDLRVPSQGLYTVLNALADSPARNLLRSQLTYIERLIEQLHQYLHVRQNTLDIQSTDVLPICQEAVSSSAALAENQQVLLIFESCLTGEAAYADVDAIALRRVLDNLIANALRATPSGGQITVQVRPSKPSPLRALVIAVSDTGIGIPADKQQLIFQPYVSGFKSGLGLGLSIVQELVAAMHGTIEVVSSPGAGSTFVVQFPQSEKTYLPT